MCANFCLKSGKDGRVASILEYEVTRNAMTVERMRVTKMRAIARKF